MKNLFVSCLILMFATIAHAENLIIVGWDGAGWNNVSTMLDNGDLPNLQDLIDDGAKIIPVKSFGRTVTGNQWPRYFTGLDEDQSGCAGNNEMPTSPVPAYDSTNHIWNQINAYWADNILYADTFLDDLDANYYVGVFVSKNDALSHLTNEMATNVTSFRRVLPSACPSSDYLDTLVTRATGFMGNRSSHVVFFHANPDYCGHRVGENGTDYINAIKDADTALGSLMTAAATGTKFIVMADHGFDEGSTQHRNATDMWMVTNLPVNSDYVLPISGTQRAFANARDLMPTILDHYGFTWETMTPKLRGRSLID